MWVTPSHRYQDWPISLDRPADTHSSVCVMVERKDGPVERWIAEVVVDGRKRRVTALTEAPPHLEPAAPTRHAGADQPKNCRYASGRTPGSELTRSSVRSPWPARHCADACAEINA